MHLLGGALIGLIAVAAADYYRLPVHENWRSASAMVAQEAASEDVVAIAGLQGLFKRYYHGSGVVGEVAPGVSEGTKQADALLADLLNQIPFHTGRTWIVVREDPRFERVAYLQRFEQYLREQRVAPRVRVVPATQGQLDVIDFVSAVTPPNVRNSSENKATKDDQADHRL